LEGLRALDCYCADLAFASWLNTQRATVELRQRHYTTALDHHIIRSYYHHHIHNSDMLITLTVDGRCALPTFFFASQELTSQR
jgi:hypothetical protein